MTYITYIRECFKQIEMKPRIMTVKKEGCGTLVPVYSSGGAYGVQPRVRNRI